MINRHVKFYLDYDRNNEINGQRKAASLLLSSAASVGPLYMDFYAIADEAKADTQNRYVECITPTAKPGVLGRIFNVKSINAYVCAQITTVEQITELWKTFIYSSPKMYRLSESARDAKEFALTGDLIESFQQVPIEDLSELLELSPCIFRDFHDDTGFEVLCRKNFENRIRDLVSTQISSRFLRDKI